jgi:hypothetical protein
MVSLGLAADEPDSTLASVKQAFTALQPAPAVEPTTSVRAQGPFSAPAETRVAAAATVILLRGRGSRIELAQCCVLLDELSVAVRAGDPPSSPPVRVKSSLGCRSSFPES